MKHYLSLYVGEIHPYKVEAPDKEQAQARAVSHLELNTPFTFNEETGDEIAFYDGDKPWTTKELVTPSRIGGSAVSQDNGVTLFETGPVQRNYVTNDFSGLGGFAVILD
jgi:hypothetical protein